MNTQPQFQFGRCGAFACPNWQIRFLLLGQTVVTICVLEQHVFSPSQSASVYARHALVFVLRGSGLVQVASDFHGLSNSSSLTHQRSLGTSTYGLSIIFPHLQSALSPRPTQRQSSRCCPTRDSDAIREECLFDSMLHMIDLCTFAYLYK